jgi:hypothetical protein
MEWWELKLVMGSEIIRSTQVIMVAEEVEDLVVELAPVTI